MNYNYVFHFRGRKLEIVTDTIMEALDCLKTYEPQLSFTDLNYFISMKTGEKTPVFNTRKISLDELEMVS